MSEYVGKSVIAIDPGGSTGIAIRLPNGLYVTCVVKSPEEVADLIWLGDFSHIIVENFQAQTIGRWGLHTVRIVGGCYALAHLKKATYVHHVPQDRWSFQTDAHDILVKSGRKFVIHEEDALAHLLRWEYDERTARKKLDTNAGTKAKS